ncbi:carbohydrate-binding domain-containing protein [Fusibacter bizertensis]
MMNLKEKNRRIFSILMILILVFALVGCNSTVSEKATDTSEEITTAALSTDTSKTDTVSETVDNAEEYSAKDLDDTWSTADATLITFENDQATIEGEGASFVDNQLTITQEGNFVISGTLLEGQIVISASENNDVHVILNGVSITNTTGPAINAQTGDKLILTLAPNTSNKLIDGSNYVLEANADEPNATLYSKIDLTINGTGTLDVVGNYDAGIRTKDDLKIISGNIIVDAKGDAIKGKNSISIKEGTFVVTAGEDAFQSNNDEDAAKGWILISNGTFEITAKDDAITAQTDLTINGGKINILSSYEGLEAQTITVNGGDIIINASDDGINAVSDTRSNQFILTGGTIYLNANGDGLDSNGSFTMTGGSIIIDGPVMSMNGALDYDGSSLISGGTLIAAGSSGMAQTPSETSTQGAFMIYFSSEQPAGTKVSVLNDSGEVILTHTPSKVFQTIVFSSEDILKGGTYEIQVNDATLTSVTMTDTVMTFSDSGESIEGGFGQMPNGRGRMPNGENNNGQMPARP